MSSHELGLSAFLNLPFEILNRSAWIDFLLMITCGKPAVRIKLKDGFGTNIPELAEWCLVFGYYQAHDEDNYICISQDSRESIKILTLDRSLQPHEEALGLLLGYPPCCAKHIANIGEDKIDEYERVTRSWKYVWPFHLIDPSGYSDGNALISHLPCSPSCALSLEIARNCLNFIMRWELNKLMGLGLPESKVEL